MSKYILYLFFLVAWVGCKKKLPESPVLPLSYSGPTLPRDTFIRYRKHTFFGEDSIYRYLREKSIKVIYRYEDPVNKIHYKQYSKSGKLQEIGYTRDTVIINPAEFHLDSIYPFSDEVIRFDKKGNIWQKGYATYHTKDNFLFADYGYETYEVYDENGILTSKYYPYYPGGMSHISEDFAPNGQRIARWVQGFPYGSGGLEEYTVWYEDGSLKEKHTYAYRFPADGISYNNRLGIETVREYYPDGKLKRFYQTKSTVESGLCPCGEWSYYNKQGKVYQRQSYPDCYTFEVDCDDELSYSLFYKKEEEENNEESIPE